MEQHLQSEMNSKYPGPRDVYIASAILQITILDKKMDLNCP